MEHTMSKDFSHINADGDPTMVDVSAKKITQRTAKAKAVVSHDPEIIALLDGDELHTKKGPVFQTAILAGIMAVKKTSELIPLCHPLPMEKCSVDIQINEQQEVEIICTTKVTSKTGGEMEALTGALGSALTIYDMCKGISHNMVIREVKLLEKTGGKSDIKST
jgi:cyclic pyranopterin phosphate synthase